jgi:hypothetical protein
MAPCHARARLRVGISDDGVLTVTNSRFTGLSAYIQARGDVIGGIRGNTMTSGLRISASGGGPSIEDKVLDGCTVGIGLTDGDLVVRGNTIRGCGVGIDAWGGVALLDNLVTDSAGDGIRFHGRDEFWFQGVIGAISREVGGLSPGTHVIDVFQG